MFQEEIEVVSKVAISKVEMLKKNPIGYFLLAMLAGIYIGFGTLLIFSIGAMLNGQPYTKIFMGISFGIALSLVVIAGAELFTGNNLVMAVGMMKKKIRVMDGLKIWFVCFIGNLVGSVLLAVLFQYSSLANGAVGEFIASSALTKMSLPALALFVRGILCNILVCLAVWCGFKCKTESGKLIMIFWCLFAFITTGFEHSVANMILLTSALLNPCGNAVSLEGWIYNIGIVTLGNMVGGIVFVAVPYCVASCKKGEK